MCSGWTNRDSFFFVCVFKVSLGVRSEQQQQCESWGGGGRIWTGRVHEGSRPAGQEGLRLYAARCVLIFKYLTTSPKLSTKSRKKDDNQLLLFSVWAYVLCCLQIQGSTTTHLGCSGWAPAPGCSKGKSGCTQPGWQKESWRCPSCRRTSTLLISQVPHTHTCSNVCCLLFVMLWLR